MHETQEFSICLTPDPHTIQAIEAIRARLPASPYRDDVPHITLLRGITAPKMWDDAGLIAAVNRLFALDHDLPVAAHVRAIENKSNQFYSASGILLLAPDKHLLTLRKTVVQTLVRHQFTVEPGELEEYLPHVTIRLGIPLDTATIESLQHDFPATQPISFNSWFLLRLVLDDDSRQMRAITPH